MVFRTASFLRRIGQRPIRLPTLMIMSAQDARGPEEHEHERTWRSALRQDALL